jgi:hypothetical protein
LGVFWPAALIRNPVLSAALGELRARRALSVPVCSSISDPAGLYYWAHPGIDLHLLCWQESMDEVERIAGHGKAVAVRPLIDQRFLAPPTLEEARAALSLPRETRVIVVSGGGWGLGDLVGGVAVALKSVPPGPWQLRVLFVHPSPLMYSEIFLRLEPLGGGTSCRGLQGGRA